MNGCLMGWCDFRWEETESNRAGVSAMNQQAIAGLEEGFNDYCIFIPFVGLDIRVAGAGCAVNHCEPWGGPVWRR